MAPVQPNAVDILLPTLERRGNKKTDVTDTKAAKQEANAEVEKAKAQADSYSQGAQNLQENGRWTGKNKFFDVVESGLEGAGEFASSDLIFYPV